MTIEHGIGMLIFAGVIYGLRMASKTSPQAAKTYGVAQVLFAITLIGSALAFVLMIAFGTMAHGQAVTPVIAPAVKKAAPVMVWKTISRIKETSDTGMVAIPEGVEVKVVERNGKKFIVYNRTQVDYEANLPSIINVEKDTFPAPIVTPLTPTVESTGLSLTDEEKAILEKGDPVPPPTDLALNQASRLKTAEINRRRNELFKERQDIEHSQAKGKTITMGKSRQDAIQKQLDALVAEGAAADYAYKQKSAATNQAFMATYREYNRIKAKAARVAEAEAAKAEKAAADAENAKTNK